jgi:hypothetical protein
MVQNCDNDILDGLAVANPSKPTIEVKCSLIDEYVKKPSAHGTSTFNGSSVTIVILILLN